MKLRNLVFWRQSGAANSPQPASQQPEPSGHPRSNVFALNARDLPADSSGIDPVTTDTSALMLPNARPRGLMNSPEIAEFFAANYFGLGRHNGAHYCTQAAQELGMEGIVARFQNAIAMRAANLEAEVGRLRNIEIQVAGVCATTSAQLQRAREHVERDIAVLREQSTLASARKGWVLEALNRYQMGFAKGLQEIVNGELLFH